MPAFPFLLLWCVPQYEMVKRLGLRGILIWDLNGCTVAEAPAMWDLLNASFGPRSPA